MRQPKKLFTRILINNWGGISHKILALHEHVNLFSGKSGSGKSTVMDAIQVVLYGSVSSNFLNKAADDSKNKRTVFSYLRGSQKDGSANRAGMDFCSQIVMEIEDTGNHITTCIGVVFEVGRSDTELRRYNFFSHSGRIPEDEYLMNGVPYTIDQIKKLAKERSVSVDNRGHGDVNRVYPSKEAYLNTLYDVIFGYVEAGRMITMEKSAIALRMTSGTGQFIRDYMFPRSRENTVAVISEQLGAYREIRERVDDLEKRIRMLDDIRKADRELTDIRADKLHAETILKYIDIEGCRAKLASRRDDLEQAKEASGQAQERQSDVQEELTSLRNRLIDVKAELKNSDYGQKQQELQETEHTIRLLADSSADWRRIINGLKRWEDDEIATDYVSNRALQLIDDFARGEVTEASCGELRTHLKAAMDNISEELAETAVSIREMTKELREKEDALEDMNNDRKPYPKELKEARRQLQSALSDRYGRTIQVHIFADLFDITDEKWKNAVEGRLGRLKKSMITEPAYALDAAKIFRKMKRFEEADLINSAAIKRESPAADQNSLYEAVHTDLDYVDWCLKRYLGRIQKCETVEELDSVRDGVTPDCYSYSNYIFRHLRNRDYTKGACIGTKISKARLKELADEIESLQEGLIGERQTEAALKDAQKYETLIYETGQLLRLSAAADELEEYYKKQERLQKELRELEDGSRAAELRNEQNSLETAVSEKETAAQEIQKEQIRLGGVIQTAERDIRDLQTRFDELTTGFVQNETLTEEVTVQIAKRTEAAYRQLVRARLDELSGKEEELTDERAIARNQFNREYPSYGFTGVEHTNDVYDQVLERCREDFEPKYKEEFRKQYELVYHSLRDNVIATIHGEIKAAYRHRRDINRMLSKIRFSDSIYQIDILPAKNENGQFYDMLMAEELDSKVVNTGGIDGQLSLMEDDFFQKYEQKIRLLTEKFMPLREEDSQNREKHRQEMEKFADYRNYLTFSMYEQVIDENGIEKKNYVDDMAGVDSGGEGQNPKYVALLAGFAMLYMQQTNRDSKIRLVLLDEAFSKMDKERSEVCLRYARELELQLIVCVPDERLQSLIRNVDSVYGFRRFKNQISMMHIDKGHYLEMIEGDDADESSGGISDTDS